MWPSETDGGVSDAFVISRHVLPLICSYFLSPLKVKRVNSRMALQSSFMFVKYVIQEFADKSFPLYSKSYLGHKVR